MATAPQPGSLYSTLEYFTPERRALLTDSETAILRFTDRYTTRMDLEAPSFSSMRIGLQMLEVAIVRMEAGLSIDDFATGNDKPAELLPEVWEQYHYYRAGVIPKADIIRKLQQFNEGYIATIVRLFGVPENILRSTGVAEARENLLRGESGPRKQ